MRCLSPTRLASLFLHDLLLVVRPTTQADFSRFKMYIHVTVVPPVIISLSLSLLPLTRFRCYMLPPGSALALLVNTGPEYTENAKNGSGTCAGARLPCGVTRTVKRATASASSYSPTASLWSSRTYAYTDTHARTHVTPLLLLLSLVCGGAFLRLLCTSSFPFPPPQLVVDSSSLTLFLQGISLTPIGLDSLCNPPCGSRVNLHTLPDRGKRDEELHREQDRHGV